MKLKYYTLWIENDPNWLDATIEYISQIVSDHGFVMYSEKCLSANEFHEKLRQKPNFLDNFDLILTDFDLGSGDRGNIIIDLIRGSEINIFTDIIFYGQDQQAINTVLNDHFIEGVYKSPREIGLFGQKFEKVFESTIKKVQDISMMRGLVISEASEMALKMLNIIKIYFSKIDTDKSIKLRNYIMKEIVSPQIKNVNTLNDKLVALEDNDFIEHNFFDDNKKLRILNKIYNMNKIDNFDFYKDYFDEIIEPRNELGHCEETEINGEKALSTRKGLRKFTHQDCIEIRKKIIIHHQRLEIIEKFILNL